MSRVEEVLRSSPRGPVHLVPFVAGGHGGMETTVAALQGVAAGGASVVELGVPFSDPIADGPAIQAAYHEALEAGATTDGVLAALGEAGIDIPALAMVSYSIVFRSGPAAFCERAKQAGLSALLCPDLPAGEAEAFAATAKEHELDPILLVAPTTPADRREVIGKLGGGFIYYLSVAGITGERDALPDELATGVADMKQHTDLPVCVGFGIHRHEHLQSLAGVAEGAIVGTALVRRVGEAANQGPDAARQAAEAYAAELLTGQASSK